MFAKSNFTNGDTVLNHASSHINYLSRFLFSRIGCAFVKFAKYKRLENNPLYGTNSITILVSKNILKHTCTCNIITDYEIEALVMTTFNVCTYTCTYLFCLNHISCLFPRQPFQADPVHRNQLITWTQGPILVGGGTVKHLWRCEGLERVIIYI